MRLFILATAVAAALAAPVAMPVATPLAGGQALAAELGSDGLHVAEWLRDTFKDLPEDFAEAEAEGKRMVLLIEQRGCIYCKQMHEETFADPRVRSLLEEKFYPVRVDLYGETEMVDTDGAAMSEKAATRRWNMLFTPTMIFLPKALDENKTAVEQAVAVMPGAFGPGTTIDMLNWVAEERYLKEDEETFQRYHARMIEERQDAGR